MKSKLFIFLFLLMIMPMAFSAGLDIDNVLKPTSIDLGDVVSYKADLTYTDSGTFNLTGANCEVLAYYQDMFQITILDTQSLTVVSSNLNYVTSSNDWIYDSSIDLVGKNVTLDITCSCSNDCLLSNGSILSGMYSVNEKSNILIDSDKSIHDYGIIGPMLFILAILLILGYCALSIGVLHAHMKMFLYFMILFCGEIMIYLFNKMMIATTRSATIIDMSKLIMYFYHTILIIIGFYFAGAYIVHRLRAVSEDEGND